MAAGPSPQQVSPHVLRPAEYPGSIANARAGRQWVEVLDKAEEVWLPQALRAIESLWIGPLPMRSIAHTPHQPVIESGAPDLQPPLGELRPARGGIFPGQAQLDRPAAQIRRAWAALGHGAYTSGQVAASVERVIQGEGVWHPQDIAGATPVAVDVTGFWRPRRRTCSSATVASNWVSSTQPGRPAPSCGCRRTSLGVGACPPRTPGGANARSGAPSCGRSPASERAG